MAGIYIHIPFCKRKCNYCDFYSSCSDQDRDRVLQRMLDELASRYDFIGDQRIETIYFGGGTPSLVDPAILQGFTDRIKELWHTDLKEVTIEVNPDDITKDYLDAIAKSDVNRLSIGIQSFDDDILRFMGRRHNARQAVDGFKMARRAGFDNISIDLIYGVKGMDEESWRKSLDMALSLDPEHISTYHLTIEPDTPFGREALQSVEDDVSQRDYDILCDKLCGYQHYEISNFAKEGFRALHNSSYWRAIPYLGIGPSAHSYNGERRSAVVSDIDAYLNSEEIYQDEILTLEDRYNEYVMIRLRCVEGVDIEQLRDVFGAEFADNFVRTANELVSKSLLLRERETYRISEKQFLISDSIIEMVFL